MYKAERAQEEESRIGGTKYLMLLHSRLQQSYYIKCHGVAGYLLVIIIIIMRFLVSTLFSALNIYIIVIVVGIIIAAGFQMQRGRRTNKLI